MKTYKVNIYDKEELKVVIYQGSNADKEFIHLLSSVLVNFHSCYTKVEILQEECK